ncbi:ATP-dependent DNA ligase [Streptosporangium nondiastaticum]|uniref:ATP-dependent DNA ligase n=2 Tax=Actinomycetes TaxID=1760 RepID=A0A9X7JQL2_9ACTN|nr:MULTISPECIES: non-homologous end-joining DNA ligase [Actinomycetes]PSJ28083.1 ATP-dependent DNA ligase [Streptosporangium nondiastaticum]WKU43760.1 non-homologous end-joining DNA ligase [Streptomyces sp. VNUA116]
MSVSSERQAVEIEGHRLALTHLDRVLFPASGHTKAQVLQYYARIAPVMVAHTADRPASFVRAPEGPGGQSWIAKNPPGGVPGWVRVVPVEHREGVTEQIVIDTTAALVALANLGAYEVHVPQWTATAGPDGHDRLVLDLDPGPGTDLVVCCRVAQRLRQLLDDDGLTAHAVVSGSKGLHLYAPVHAATGRAAGGYAKELAARMMGEHPGLVVVSMARVERRGKVLIDWSQNASAKTTAAPYTVRLREGAPGVAAPVTWDEVAACRDPADLAFTPEEVLDRAEAYGDLLSPLTGDATRAHLP